MKYEKAFNTRNFCILNLIKKIQILVEDRSSTLNFSIFLYINNIVLTVGNEALHYIT